MKRAGAGFMKQNWKKELESLEDLDIRNMEAPELHELSGRLNQLYDNLQLCEPEDPDSEEYESWEESLEDIDDLLDDIQDLLEDLQ